jgi:hypothetical protein
VRDPRDALYSWYRFRTEFVRDPLDRLAAGFDDWLCRPGPTGADRIDDWVDFYGSWLGDETVPHAVTTFERLKKEPVGALREGLRVFGLTAGEEQLERAARDSSFDAMRRHEQERGGSGAGILRRGRPGEWREWMTPKTLELFRRDAMVALARRFGYDLESGRETRA